MKEIIPLDANILNSRKTFWTFLRPTVTVFSCCSELYLDVIVVLSRQPRGQFTFGPGAPLPQPTHFGWELQGDWMVMGGAQVHGVLKPQKPKGREKQEKRNRKGEMDAKWSRGMKSWETLGINHKRSEWKLGALLWSKGLCLMAADLYRVQSGFKRFGANIN